MENLYQHSQLLTKKDFHKLEKALEKAWSKDTTFPELKEKWTEENKAYGQCAITALIIYDLYGGKIIYNKANFHLWNELPDGTQQDFSRNQFLDQRTFSIYKYKTKDEILHDETGQRTKIEARYKLLRKNFQIALKKV